MENDYKVADMSLADFGRREISLAENEMPGLMALRKEYKNKKPDNLTVCILDRPRHKKIFDELKDLNVNIKLITDGDVQGALYVSDPKYNIDMFILGLHMSLKATMEYSIQAVRKQWSAGGIGGPSCSADCGQSSSA